MNRIYLPPPVVVQNEPEIEESIQPAEVWLPDPIVIRETASVYGNSKYEVEGIAYEPWGATSKYEEIGTATWRGDAFEGITTFNEEIFRNDALMAAHKYLPLPCYIRVTNQKTSASTIVRVNDRGPFQVEGIVDLSRAAAKKLGLLDSPDAEVHIELISDLYLPVFYLETDAIFGVENLEELVAKFSRLQNVNSVVLPQEEANWFRVRLGPFGNVDDAKRVRGWGILNANTESSIIEE